MWDYAIDKKYQNMHYGTKALQALIEYKKETNNAKEFSTTYICGNDVAAKMYEKIGFVVTDIVDEDDIHEVNMLLSL